MENRVLVVYVLRALAKQCLAFVSTVFRGEMLHVFFLVGACVYHFTIDEKRRESDRK
jgi:hypothetical protein